jgi:hypothetical protein
MLRLPGLHFSNVVPPPYSQFGITQSQIDAINKAITSEDRLTKDKLPAALQALNDAWSRPLGVTLRETGDVGADGQPMGIGGYANKTLTNGVDKFYFWGTIYNGVSECQVLINVPLQRRYKGRVYVQHAERAVHTCDRLVASETRIFITF